MTVLRRQIGQMGLAAPKSTAWKITAALAALPILILVVTPTLIEWFGDASPDFRKPAVVVAGLVLNFLPTWIALFLNHRHVVYIFLSNLLCVLMAIVGWAADMSVISFGFGDEFFWSSVVGWHAVLIWSFINGKCKDAAELNQSPPPIPSMTTIIT